MKYSFYYLLRLQKIQECVGNILSFKILNFSKPNSQVTPMTKEIFIKILQSNDRTERRRKRTTKIAMMNSDTRQPPLQSRLSRVLKNLTFLPF